MAMLRKVRLSAISREWFPPSGWKTFDPLYLWSAAAGLFVAFVLIVIAVVMH